MKKIQPIYLVCFLVITMSIGIAPISIARDYNFNLDAGEVLIVEVTKFDEDNGLFTYPYSYILKQYGVHSYIIKNDAKEGEKKKIEITESSHSSSRISLDGDIWLFTDGDFASKPDVTNGNVATLPSDPSDFIYETSTIEIIPAPVDYYIGGIRHPSVSRSGLVGDPVDHIIIKTSESTLHADYNLDTGIAEKIQIKNSSGQLIYEVTIEISIFGGGIPGYDILFVLACLSLTVGLLLVKKRRLSHK